MCFPQPIQVKVGLNFKYVVSYSKTLISNCPDKQKPIYYFIRSIILKEIEHQPKDNRIPMLSIVRPICSSWESESRRSDDIDFHEKVIVISRLSSYDYKSKRITHDLINMIFWRLCIARDWFLFWWNVTRARLCLWLSQHIAKYLFLCEL